MSQDNSIKLDAWYPGIKSQIPGELLPLVTLYRPESSNVDYKSAKELSDFCGIKAAELVSFKVERLLVHELLIRVTADLSVPDGPNYEDLGINMRAMVKTIHEQYAKPQLPAIQAVFDNKIAQTRRQIEALLQADLFDLKPQPPQQNRSFFAGLFKRRSNSTSTSALEEPVELQALRQWQSLRKKSKDPIERVVLAALHKVVSSIAAHRGRVPHDLELVSRITTNMAANEYGSLLLSDAIEPILTEAIDKENYCKLPAQAKPLVMNVKGASASGKSTIRQQQRQLAKRLDVGWEDVALISPDYWRKYLLDYASLDEHFKYAAMLTGQELAIIDKKLDAYMASKAEQNNMPHLLIDRFRFDSFSVEEGGSYVSRLLSRFGDRVFLYFMVTPPAETVVRAWARGQTTGRYKAVDDLLYHNIEAFNGMPELFLSWVLSEDKQIHFEFLDNDVPLGQVPSTAAFGWNNHMIVLDLSVMQNIDRFRCVNVDAKCAEDVLTDQWAATDFSFMQRCINCIALIQFADRDTGSVYAEFRDAKLVWSNPDAVQKHHDTQTIERLFTGVEEKLVAEDSRPRPSLDVAEEKRFTLGGWA